MSAGQNNLMLGKHATLGTLPVRVTTGGAPGAGGDLCVASASERKTVKITRPNNTTPYAAGDVVGPNIDGEGNVWSISGLAKANGIIVAAQLRTDHTNVTNGNFRALIYGSLAAASQATANDNAAVQSLLIDTGDLLGHIDFTLIQETTGTNGHVLVTGQNIILPSTEFWGNLVAMGAYTPIGTQPFELAFHII